MIYSFRTHVWVFKIWERDYIILYIYIYSTKEYWEPLGRKWGEFPNHVIIWYNMVETGMIWVIFWDLQAAQTITNHRCWPFGWAFVSQVLQVSGYPALTHFGPILIEIWRHVPSWCIQVAHANPSPTMAHSSARVTCGMSHDAIFVASQCLQQSSRAAWCTHQDVVDSRLPHIQYGGFYKWRYPKWMGYKL